MERRQLLKILGAEVILTEGIREMNGAVEKAEELAAKIEGSFILQQLRDPANPEIHRRTTAEEILNDTDENLIILSPVSARGEHMGVGEVLKKRRPSKKQSVLNWLIPRSSSEEGALKRSLPGQQRRQHKSKEMWPPPLSDVNRILPCPKNRRPAGTYLSLSMLMRSTAFKTQERFPL